MEVAITLTEAKDLVYQLTQVISGRGESAPIGVDTLPMPDRAALMSGAVNKTEEVLVGAPHPVYYIDETKYPETGGIFRYLSGVNGIKMKYPRKGFPFTEASSATNRVKRYLMTHLNLMRGNWLYAASLLRRKNLSMWFEEFNMFSYGAMMHIYLQDIRYQKPCREIRKFVEVFMDELGMKNASKGFALNVATILEYDNAYLLRIQDLANETSKEQIVNGPIKELKRLLKILQQRDPTRPKLVAKAEKLLFILRIGVLIPAFRRAFVKAMHAIDFENIKMDEGDKHEVMTWKGYDFLGKSFEDRIKEYLDMYDGKIPEPVIIGLEKDLANRN